MDKPIQGKNDSAWLIFLSLIVILVGLSVSEVGAQDTNRAALVVQYGVENYETHCVEFTETSISGYELLQQAGLSIIASFESQGAAICKIEDTGCPANDCFCQSPPDYWSYWRLESDEWVYSPLGSSNAVIEDGDVDGWNWGPGDPPIMVSFDQICADITPTNTQAPTATQTAPATQTPTITAQPGNPTATNTPYPPPARPTNDTNQTPYPANPTAVPPYPGATQISASLLQDAQSTPLGPRIMLPAKLIFPTPQSRTPSPIPTLPTDIPSTNAPTQALESGGPEKANQSLTYLVFGLLALGLVSIIIFQSVKKRE